MITFDDVRKEKQLTYCLIPATMLAPLGNRMEKAGLLVKGYSQLKVKKKQAPEMKYLNKKDVQNAIDFFRNAGYANPLNFGLIVSYCNVDDLRAKSLLFFGETKDPDYKKFIEAQEEKANQSLEECELLHTNGSRYSADLGKAGEML